MHCLLVDASHAIINEVGREQHGHQEDLRICLLSFLERAESFSIHHHVLNGRIVRVLDQIWPHPQTLGACVNGRPDLKPGILVEQDPIKDITLASAILADYSNDSNVFLLVGLHEPFHGLRVDHDF